MSMLIRPFFPWWQTALDFVFPAECVYCHNFLGDDRVTIFCRACWKTITPLNPPICAQCGNPFPSNTVLPGFVCGTCRQTPPFFDRVFAVAPYETVLKTTIHQFKFNQKHGLGQPLAQLLITHLPAEIDLCSYHVILPVPLHKSRQKQRGYNQSALLAKYLSQHYHIPLIGDNLIRIRDTGYQYKLSPKQRQENVKNAFQVRDPESLRDKNLIVIDDIVTTTATVNECARMLKKAGARSVLVLALSRAGVHTHAANNSA